MLDSNHGPERIERGNYQADVLRHTSDTDQFWYYVIKRKDSKEIIDLVKLDSYEEAMDAARQALARMNRATLPQPIHWPPDSDRDG